MKKILFVVSFVVVFFGSNFFENKNAYAYESQIQQEVNAVRVNQAKAYFDQLSTKTSFYYARDVLQGFILEVIADNVATWNELGFTEEQVRQRVNAVRVNQAKAYFDQLSTETSFYYARDVLQGFILEVIADNVATWNELGFTEEQVRQRVEGVRVK